MLVKKGNIFDHIPRQSAEELFETILDTPELKLERILSFGQATPDGAWYDQKRDEWVLLLKGSARIRIEGRPQTVDLEPGDYLLLPAHQRHRVEWTSKTEETVWLALHFNPVRA